MEEYIHYIDNFLENPEEIKKYAIGRKDYKHTPKNGKYTFTGKEIYPNDLNISSYMNLISYKLKADIAFIQPYQGWIRSLTLDEYNNKVLHVHFDSMGISGVLCLNEQYDGGNTSFYKHIESGLTNINDIQLISEIAKMKKMSTDRFLDQLLEDGEDMNKWKKIKEIDYKFNRLILFDTNIFHLAGKGLGDSIDNSKLTMQFQFYFKRKKIMDFFSKKNPFTYLKYSDVSNRIRKTNNFL